jgi:hypothetical protein
VFCCCHLLFFFGFVKTSSRFCCFVGREIVLPWIDRCSVVINCFGDKERKKLACDEVFFCEFLFKSLIFWFCCGFLCCRIKGWRQGDWVALDDGLFQQAWKAREANAGLLRDGNGGCFSCLFSGGSLGVQCTI